MIVEAGFAVGLPAPHAGLRSTVQTSRSRSRTGSPWMRKASPSISMRSPGRGFGTSATRRSMPGGLRPEPRLAEAGDLVRAARDHADEDRSAALGDVDRIAGDVAVREERVERGGDGGHQVRRAERSTCGRVQIGSGLLSISSRTHSSRSRSGIVRA